ncbi:MAG: hypothetical protein IT308_11170 [Anaerolineaceae bacterium]|nr:hypothetical protein [Anaerolineaceae bacterium]
MRIRSPLVPAVTIAVGFVVLLGYFFPSLLVQNLRALLIDWGVSLAGVAALVGILNLVVVHWHKANDKENRSLYSLLLLAAFLITFGVGLWLSPADPGFQHVIIAIQVPVETSLMAVLAITLAYASLRLLQRRKGTMGTVFVVSALFFLLFLSGFLPVVRQIPLVGGVADFLHRLPVAGARGILLGIAAGSLMTGLRIFLGADRPYNG